MLKIGITGGIGSGKSRVCDYWSRRFSIPCISLDQICRELMEPGRAGVRALREHFGEFFFQKDGTLNRQLLRHTIFSDATIRHQVDDIIHPLARLRMVDSLVSLNAGSVLLEIPLLFEAGWQREVDRVVVVFADSATRCSRLRQRDGLGEDDIKKSFAAQWKLSYKALLADHVIDNSGSWPCTCLLVHKIGALLQTATCLHL
jgi:dephospho-CoA kinase